MAVNELERKEEGAPEDFATAARWPRRRTPPYYCLIGVDEFFMLVLEVEASKPSRIDLKSGQRYRSDPFV